jgi:hypothetical protein
MVAMHVPMTNELFVFMFVSVDWIGRQHCPRWMDAEARSVIQRFNHPGRAEASNLLFRLAAQALGTLA